MHVHLLKSLAELSPYAEAWDRLASAVPFRSWTWLSHWWRAYGPADDDSRQNRQLAVLALFDQSDALVGVAPWYARRSAATGRVLRMLGSGEVCSDYLSLLCQHGVEDRVVEAVADFLLRQPKKNAPHALRWDLISLESVDFEDCPVNSLVEQMSGHGCAIHRRTALNCWRLDLPASWEDYLALFSKSFRRQVQRMEREYLNNGRAVLRSVQSIDELPQAMDLLIDMHQRRRRSLREPGCFASPRFEAFYRGVLPDLMRQGLLQFFWLEIDGRPVAAEYHLTGGGVLYAYQAGVDPDAMKMQPGKLLNLLTIRWAMEQGYRALDFLRGDEPYKAHLRAAPRPSLQIRIVPNRPAARLRNSLYLAARQAKQLLKKE
jgi:CelD/BcsL family acetyltransferase involved in cellulose biosynthesis